MTIVIRDENNLKRTTEPEFTKIVIPKLVDGKFFILKGKRYIPILYLADQPIILKKESIKYYSLFCPITLYIKNKVNGCRVIIYGNNINMVWFLRYIFNDNQKLLNDVICNFNISDEIVEMGMKESFDRVLTYVLEQIGITRSNSWKSSISRLNELFFDKWTKTIYDRIYSERIREIICNDLKKLKKEAGFNINDITLLDIIYLSSVMFDSRDLYDYINLKYKRLVFVETLLNPIFKKVLMSISNKLSKSSKEKSSFILSMIEMNNLDDIISYFFSDMHGRILYEPTTEYPAFDLFKATYKLPGVTSDLPRIISSIHPSYKNRACPITISNNNPGEVISLVPTLEVDKWGFIS